MQDNPHEFGANASPLSPGGQYWRDRAEFWRGEAVALGYAPKADRKLIAGTLRDDAQAMRELGVHPSVAENMEDAAAILDPPLTPNKHSAP